MQTSTLAAGAALLLLAGCTTHSATEEGDSKPGVWSGNTAEANAANPNCRMVNRANGLLRPGTNVPLHMVLVNTGAWCFSGFGLSGVDTSGSTLVNHPSAGEVRVLPERGGVAFGYRPKPGFAGSDDFLIAMPTGFGYEINLAVSVTVAVKPGH